MKRFSLTLSVFALLLATMLPALAKADAGANNTAPLNLVSSTSDPLLRVLVSTGIIGADEARSLNAGNSGAQRYELVLFSTHAEELRSVAIGTPIGRSGRGSTYYKSFLIPSLGKLSRLLPIQPYTF